MGRSTISRRSNQAKYQRRYRRQQTSLRKPSRDDVARMALHWLIVRSLKQKNEGELGKWSEIMVQHLVKQGFDADATRRRIDQLIERYENGWGFQGKPHLRRGQTD
jgi:hypothetical protein